MHQIALLGATGSIGTSCLEVARFHHQQLKIYGVSAHRGWKKLAKICHEFQPEVAVISDDSLKAEVQTDQFPKATSLLFGSDALAELSAAEEVETVVAAIVGA